MREITILRIFVGLFGFVVLVPGWLFVVSLVLGGTSQSLHVENVSASRLSVVVDHVPLPAEVEQGAKVNQSLSGHQRVEILSVNRISTPAGGIAFQFPKGVSARGISMTVSDLSSFPVVPAIESTPVSPPSAPLNPSPDAP